MQLQYLFAISRPDVVTVLVESDEDDAVCGFVSVQPLGCPFSDKASEARYRGRWQTMLTKASIDIRMKEDEDYKYGFYIVAMVDRDPKGCLKGSANITGTGKWLQQPNWNRLNLTNFFFSAPSNSSISTIAEKRLRVSISPQSDSIVLGVVAVLVFYFGIFVVTYALSVCFQMPVDGRIVEK
jgi:hypothetical protein